MTPEEVQAAFLNPEARYYTRLKMWEERNFIEKVLFWTRPTIKLLYIEDGIIHASISNPTWLNDILKDLNEH
jgi:hypothetical protein